MEVYRMLPEGTRAEIINAVLFMSPAPALSHQETVASLGTLLYQFVSKRKLGKVYFSPVDVYLNSKNAFQPDIVFVSNKNFSILKDDGIYGAPDFVIEVVSPGTRQLDLNKKKSAYEKAGVTEYWVVDPLTNECLGFAAKAGRFDALKKQKNKFTSPLLGLTFKV
jgi:Uma2 family endonuclease